MNIDLEKLLELAGKATPGNWGTDGHTGVHGESGLLADTCFAHDAAFISAANPTVVTELVSIVKDSTLACIAARTGIAIEGIFGRVVRDQCSCGEPISVELDCPRRTSRTDKKRPFYPDAVLPDGLDPQRYSEHGTSVFRCRKFGEPVCETVPAAKYGEAA